MAINYATGRILIDNKSSTNIIFWDASTKMTFDSIRLKPVPMALTCFSREVVQPVDAIILPIIVRKELVMTTTMTDFQVVKTPYSCNDIIRHPMLNNIKTITLTSHLK